MDKQFTASEVREMTDRMRDRMARHEFPSIDEYNLSWEAMNVFADRLEADEKAVPFTWVLEFNDPDPQVDFSEGSECPKGWQDKAFPLYTHPSPSDAERLAEALRNMLDVVDPAHWPTYVRDAKKALAAHSTQTHPPVASVPDVDAMVTRFLNWRLPQDFAPDAGISFKPMPDEYMPHCWPTGTNLFHAGQAKEMILHMLAAQENPNG